MCSDGDPNPPANGKELHFGFIDFLFSLSVAQVAIKFSEIVRASEGGVGSFYASENWPAYAHLFLALMVITTSWIGWNYSKVSHRNTTFNSIWSLDFLELLIDVLLVVVYYILVEHVDRPTEASCKPEAVCIACVFVLYFVWDIVSKCPWRREESGEYFGMKRLVERGWVSLFCMIIAVGMAAFHHVPVHDGEVIAFDISLIGLAVLFRELKVVASNKPVGWGWWRTGLSVLLLVVPLISFWYFHEFD